MVFGEIVEPSTRALFDDDYTEYPPDNATRFLAKLELPQTINVLVIVESPPIINFFHKSVIAGKTPIHNLKDIGLEVYKFDDEKYIVITKPKEHSPNGQVVEMFTSWLQKAVCIYAITSTAIVLHQNTTVPKNSVECFIRSLTFKTLQKFKYKKLEIPNLATGLGANVLSYCIHKELPCCLFVAYMDLSFLDSLSTKPLMKLAQELALPVTQTCKLKMNAPDNNLYM